jgi:hypothetical protein
MRKVIGFLAGLCKLLNNTALLLPQITTAQRQVPRIKKVKKQQKTVKRSFF